MQSQSDEWIENQVIQNLRKHGLPGQSTRLYDEHDAVIPTELKDYAASNMVGRPVVAFIGDQSRWTLLGTQKIASKNVDTLTEVLLDQIQEIHEFPRGMPKECGCEYLEVVDRHKRSHIIWGPVGSQFYALWNTLLKLTRLQGVRSKNWNTNMI
jgi:hypothetical protein